MKGTRKLALALLAVAGIAGVASLVMTQLDTGLGQWLRQVGMSEGRARFACFVAAPLLAGVVSGSFSTALFRTKRVALPLAPAVGLVMGVSISWLASVFHFHLRQLLGDQQWRLLIVSLPLGALLGTFLVKRLYPTGKG